MEYASSQSYILVPFSIKMLWWLFLTLYGDVILALMAALSIVVSDKDSPTDPDHSSFFKDMDFMFPENFLSRYPHETNPFRFKILAYLIFNLLVKGYASVDPSRFWSNYNRDDFYRAVIDAAFFEHLSDFAESEDKDFLFSFLENAGSNLSKPLSKEEIAVDRVGQYLDFLSETRSRTEIKKGNYDILKETKESSIISKRQTAKCDMHIPIQASGIPGIDYPNFCDIPKTSFSCRGKRIPGIYADYETGCQAFHICWPRRRDTLLCPIGTIFNQSLLTCDVWHDTGCFSSPLFHREQFLTNETPSLWMDVPNYDGSCESLLSKPLRLDTKFLPAKCEVRDKMGRKLEPYDEGELKARLKMIYNQITEMIQRLTKLRKELDDEMISGRSPRSSVLTKGLNSAPNLSTETEGEATEFTRKVGETDFKPTKVSNQGSHPGKLLSAMKPSLSVTSSKLLNPSKSLKEHIESSSKKDVPDIVMKSLRLGGIILNEGIIPFAKQVMMESYRKIESKKQ